MRVYDSGHFDIRKDRERCAHPPFRTLEEMKIVSAVNGWTDPARLYDVATEAAAEIARRNGEPCARVERAGPGESGPAASA